MTRVRRLRSSKGQLVSMPEKPVEKYSLAARLAEEGESTAWHVSRLWCLVDWYLLRKAPSRRAEGKRSGKDWVRETATWKIQIILLSASSPGTVYCAGAGSAPYRRSFQKRAWCSHGPTRRSSQPSCHKAPRREQCADLLPDTSFRHCPWRSDGETGRERGGRLGEEARGKRSLLVRTVAPTLHFHLIVRARQQIKNQPRRARDAAVLSLCLSVAVFRQGTRAT